MSNPEVRSLRDKAAKARQFASCTTDTQLISNLEAYAEELEERARRLEAQPTMALSKTAMEATSEPSTTKAVAALRIEEIKDSTEE